MEHAAPVRYRDISPIGFWVSWAFVPFNVFLAWYLYATRHATIPLTLFPLTVWAALFMAVAAYLLAALLLNSLRHIRASMFLGVLFKTYWAWALLAFAIRDGFVQELYLLDLWFMVAIVQAVVAIYTPPRIDYGIIAQ